MPLLHFGLTLEYFHLILVDGFMVSDLLFNLYHLDLCNKTLVTQDYWLQNTGAINA